MNSITDQISCPICLEIPENEIFQCINGHNCCAQCCTSIVRCPQCRVPYGEVKVRNRTVEAIVQSLKVDCPNKANGCSERFLPLPLEAHKNVCEYSTNNVKLCQRMGFNCEYKANAQNIASIIQHLHSEHGAITQTVAKFCMKLDGFPSHGTVAKDKSWPPHVVKSANSNIVITVHLKNNNLSCLGVILEDSSFQQNQRVMEFQIKGLAEEAVDVIWHSSTKSLVEIAKRATAPLGPVCMDYIRHYAMSADGSFSVNVCIAQPKEVRDRGHQEAVQARCISPYEAWNEEEITLRKGDIVRVISKDIYYGWWECEFNEKTGLVPENKLALVSNSEGSTLVTRSPNRWTNTFRWVKCKDGGHGTVQNSVLEFDNLAVRAVIPGLNIKVAGYLLTGDTTAVICFKNVVYRVPEYEILCIPEGHWSWSSRMIWGKRIPHGSISTGLNSDGTETYVGGMNRFGGINAKEGHFYKMTGKDDAVENSTGYFFVIAKKPQWLYPVCTSCGRVA